MQNKDEEIKVSAYMDSQQIFQFGQPQSPVTPQPLPFDASPQETLNWAIANYLPERQWEIGIQQTPSEKIITNGLADSFVNWILAHYPEMTLLPVADSYLNYSVASMVQKLCRTNPVFWVVVGGLGWLDHQDLMSLLLGKYNLAIETPITPKFSILPTKTEYAKWSLYTQLLPSDISWTPDPGKAFAKIGIGKRYTDKQIDKLYNALKKNTQKLYCWDTDKFNNLYQSQKDWQSLYQLERPDILENIAQEINYCLQQYPKPENLKIVISSDHGQIMGNSDKIEPYPPELQPQGRMAIGKTDEPLYVVLERELYHLPHDISVVRNSKTFKSFSYTSKKQIIGSHGGLFPEEVVVGVSVLTESRDEFASHYQYF
ncbi:MAG: hypothetical protein KME64_13260 [Scytonematopsis contorta HA4267-MV1]|jgi:hypothetical protein|nr:hypothetical protein [Scytonematopsis contorta HA4267-MV1]